MIISFLIRALIAVNLTSWFYNLTILTVRITAM